MRKLLLQTVMLVLLAVSGFSQADKTWSLNNQSRLSIIADKATSRLSFPANITLFNLNFEPFKQELFSIVTPSTKRSTIISLPNAAGGIEKFEVYEASNFEPLLQAKFPAIRAFSGRGITDPYATLKLSISPQGIQTMILRTGKENEFMEPYSKDHTVYAVYTSQREKGKLPWKCTTVDTKMVNELNEKVAANSTTARSTGDLKTMRLAQSVTAEYSNFFGATSAAQVGLVLAAINNTLTRCNGVYEKDLALHLNLIASTTNVIYYNPATDPYDDAATGVGGTWNAQLQNTLTANIGEANYDIGHLFGASGGGGNAGCIGCICSDGSKGSGFTSPSDGVPQGDNFDIDYVVHEVGHQLGGNHTFSYKNEGSGVNKEVGSGITIMGYAGITAQDVAPHSIDMYHEATIAQIQTNLGAKACPVTTAISNATPVVATLSNFTIPKSTPFALTGSATDANAGDVLTYCWEQNDNAGSSQTGASSVAKANKAKGPNWISFSPTVSPTRYFPKLATILAGGLLSGPLPGGDAGANTEALSSVARTLNFRLTVRDNAVYSSTAPVSVGQTQFKDMVVTVDTTTGPFAVTAPNTAVTYIGNASQTITWAVANTTAAPVSCANVKISLSTDGGQTFPTVLAANTPNDGSQAVTIPNTPTTTARIKIEAVGNIFFDISNTNFTITAGTGCGAPAGLTSSAITASGATVSWTAVAGAVSYDVDYKANSSATWLSAVAGTTATSKNITGLAAGTLYDWRVRTNCTGGSSSYSAAQFTTSGGANCSTAFEPNETQATAAAITSGVTNSAAISTTTDVDYYKITTTTPSNLAFNLVGPAGVDYDVFIYNSAGTQIGAGQTSSSTETVTVSSQPTGTYFAKVVGYLGANSATCYTIKATATAAGCATAFEPNETQATAAALTSGVTYSAAISTTTDIDYFKITTTSTSKLVFNLAGPASVDYDLFIYNNGGTQIGSGETSSSTETVTISSKPAGTYFIKVTGFNGANSTTCYTIKATATPICQSSLDNSTNNSPSGAATIPFNTNVNGRITPAGDIDDYKFVITTGGTITVTLANLPGDYDLQLLNSSGNQVAISENTGTTSESISYTAAAGTYYAQVYGFNGANSSTLCYTLKVQLGTATRGTAAALKTKVSIYPNPVHNELKINMGGYTQTVSANVTDMYGRRIMSKTFAGASSINTASLAAGVYMVTIRDKNGIVVKEEKIVKE